MNKPKYIAWSAGGLVLITAGLLFFQGLDGTAVLTEALGHETVELHFLEGCYLLLGLSGIALFIRKGRGAGWFVSGNIFGILLCLSITLWDFNPGIIHRGHTFSTLWAPLTILAIALSVCIAALHCDVAEVEAISVLEQKLRSEVAQKKAAEKSLDNLRQQENISRKENYLAEGEHKATITSLRENFGKEMAAHCATRESHLYESQLVAGFVLSLGFAWNQFSKEAPFSLNFFGGNRDRELSDFVGETEGTCWLMELKRNWSVVPTELKKSARLEQLNALGHDAKMLEAAKRCHWLGWGKKEKNEILVELSSYWDAFQGVANRPKQVIQCRDFSLRAFNPATLEPIGITPKEFALYLQFLSENSGQDSQSDPSTIAAMVVHRDRDGKIRYYIEPDLTSVAIQVTDRLGLIEKNHRLELEKRRRIEPGRGHTFGI